VELASGRLRDLGDGYGPKYVAGSLVYAKLGGQLYRQTFDLERLALVGPAEEIANGIPLLLDGAPFDVSPSGALVYRTGESAPGTSPTSRLVVTDRAGRVLRTIPARVPWTPRFSPDGRRIVYGAHAPGRETSDLWITDLSTGATQRMTTDGQESNDPQWSRDGRTIAFSTRGGEDLVALTFDGGERRAFGARPGFQFPTDMLPDGSGVLFIDVKVSGERVGNPDLWVQPVDGSAPRPWLATAAREIAARASPDGRWIAYTGDETGRDEIYVQSYPTPALKTLVSTAGGTHPAWRGDGRELYYWQGDRLMAARLEPAAPGKPLVVRERTPLFRAPYPSNMVAMYDVSRDGQRFVIVRGHDFANRLVVLLDGLGPGSTRDRRE
jgi:hypothetical protein